MSLDQDLSELKDYLLHAKKHNLLSGVKRDSMEFILWELKFVDMFLRLQSFTFACECGMLDFAQKMHEIWKSEDSDSNADGQTEIWKTKLEFRAKYSFPSIPFSANKVDDTSPTPLFVMEFIDTVVENLMNVVKTDDPSSLRFAPGSKEQIKDFIMELMLLRLFVRFISNKCIEPQNQHTFFTHVLIEVGDTAMVTWLYFPIGGNEDKDLSPCGMNVLFSDLIQMKIKHIQPGIRKIYVDVLQDLKSTIQPGWHPNIIQNKHTADRGYVEVLTHNLVELPMVSNPTRVVSLNDQMETLQEMLALLRDNLIHLPVQDLEFHEMDTVIIDAGLLFYSLYGSKREKVDMALEDVNQALGLDLPSNIQPIKVTICLIVRKVFQYNLPRIHGLGYVDFLLNNLKEFQDRYANSLTSVKSLLQIIEKKLESLQPSLKALAEESQNKLKNLQDCATRLISKAYEVEYVVAACINKGVPDWCIEHWLQDLIEEITHIKAEVAEITEKQLIVVDLVSHNTLESSTVHTSSQLAKNQSMTEGIVGFEDVMEELRRRLIKEPRDLDVISLVGMPGLGKTTLAYKLYSDQSVISHFDIRAQCCVSQAYKRADLLMAILHDAIGVRPSASDEAGVADELRKTLMAKRYLVLIDDVWGANAWDDLRSCFYDARNGSRIILTTRHFEVANYATSSYISTPIHLRMFDEDESWKLLEDRVFGKGSCSPALEEVGQQIAKRCGGLPLSIVLVAGILAKVEKTEESWKQVAMTLGSHIHKDSKAIVEQSYQDLPCHLRPCFLYFGAFSEDSVINASMLTSLWISEAFIKSCEGKSLEEISEGYLENLIGRNLVMVSKRTYLNGNVKSCCIHDVLLDFCKERATKENFLLWIKQDQSVNLSSYIYSHKQHAQRRLAFCEVDNLEEWSSSCSLVGSVLSTKDTEFFGPLGVSSLAFAISGILRNFKFLKVLILEHSFIIDFFPTELVYLRFFSAKIVMSSITSSISNLWNLETLILKRKQGGLQLPSTVWNMVKLKSLHISDFRIEDALPENSTILNNLKTLSAPYFSCVKDAELMFRRTPNLQKLICEFQGDNRFEYHVLNFPTQLETLKISRSEECTSIHMPFCISAPNIKNLKLSGFYLDHRHFSVVAQLQNLQVLKLLLVGFPDSEWNVSNGEFPQLKVLKLHSLDYLKEWTVADDAFPILERLVLHGCWNLKEIPSCFEDVSFLKYIEVEKCSESVVKSARDIRETQVEEYQNIDFKLMIIKDYDTSSDEDESSEATSDGDESYEASSDGDKSYEASSDGDESYEASSDGDKSYEASSDGDESSEKNDDS